jgi:hypothetical protein
MKILVNVFGGAGLFTVGAIWKYYVLQGGGRGANNMVVCIAGQCIFVIDECEDDKKEPAPAPDRGRSMYIDGDDGFLDDLETYLGLSLILLIIWLIYTIYKGFK